MFDPAWLVERIKYLYTADPLKAKLQEVFGSATTLEPDNLKCLLLIVTKNVTTDSPWPLSSNPDALQQPGVLALPNGDGPGLLPELGNWRR
jgi:hypothetical protein